MAPTLLVLAAGLGSRYGGLKQIDPVGPSGETTLDYAVFDAIRAGFGRVVFVISRELEDAFRASAASRYAGRIASDIVLQDVGDVPSGCAVPAGRRKPWGTGHAVWCAREAIAGPFAVINADDFYGASSYERLGGFLGTARGGRYALVGFRLASTLSESGPVSRGVCREESGMLVSIAEEPSIAPVDVGPGRRFSGAEIVSMNFWGFTPSIFGGLGDELRAFLEGNGSDPRAEFYLPVAVSDLVRAGRAEVRVIASEEPWFGITYREDRARAAAAVDGLVRRGAYPRRLFG